jgi:hypothetical protein
LAARTVWGDVVERLDEALGAYDLRIKRDLVDVAMAQPANGQAPAPQKAYAYRVELTHGGVTASSSGLDQPEVVLPQLCLRLLSHVNVEAVGARPRSAGYEAFQAALDATRIERGIDEGENTHHEED